MGSISIAERVQALAEQVAIDHGVELVHAEVAGPDNKPIVRIFIDKPQGVTHEDCSAVSFHLGTILDVEDFIHASYTLEVSSPDLNCFFAAARTASFIASITRSRSIPCSWQSASMFCAIDELMNSRYLSGSAPDFSPRR